jgi:hypothetical protein
MEINGDLESSLLENPARFLFRLRTHPHPFFYNGSPIKKNIDPIWIDGHPRMTQSAKNSSPVGILSEESRFHQRRMSNRIGSLSGILIVLNTADQPRLESSNLILNVFEGTALL